MKRKADLPQKPCAACGRPFAWRRKWAACWDEVRFCSDACRSGRRDAARRRQAGAAKGQPAPRKQGAGA